MPPESTQAFRCPDDVCPNQADSEDSNESNDSIDSNDSNGTQPVFAPSSTEIQMELSSFGETAGTVDFQAIELMAPLAPTAACAARADPREMVGKGFG